MNDYTKNSAGSERELRIAGPDEEALGPLRQLPGTWANVRPGHRLNGSAFKGQGTLAGQGASPFDGRGWNLIALPFAEPGQFRNFRVLMNQYNEVLKFTTIDEKIPNRGITTGRPADVADQRVAALDYEQMIAQIHAEDISVSEDAGSPELPIHHEPGFFLHMREQKTNRFDIARLASIPHGSALTALGRSETIDGPPSIHELSGFPEGVHDNILEQVSIATDPASYLFPYHHFVQNPFKGVLEGTEFPGFSPLNANSLLQLGMPPNVVKTTILHLATDVLEASISNIPFVVRQADATVMHSTFWIMELDSVDDAGRPNLVLAYSQFILLDFFDRFDGRPGHIRWPHISINMMEKVAWPDEGMSSEQQVIMKSAS